MPVGNAVKGVIEIPRALITEGTHADDRTSQRDFDPMTSDRHSCLCALSFLTLYDHNSRQQGERADGIRQAEEIVVVPDIQTL